MARTQLATLVVPMLVGLGWLAEPGPARALALPAKPSAELQGAAEADCEAGQFERAALGLHAIVSGQVPGDRPRAQLWLGRALTGLGFHRSAGAVFRELAASEDPGAEQARAAYLRGLVDAHLDRAEALALLRSLS